MARKWQVGFIGLAVTVAVTVAGCTPAPGPGGPAPGPDATPSGSPAVAASGPVTSVVTEVRTYRPPTPGPARAELEFADTNHGYALVIGTVPVDGGPNHERYRVSLLATTDGGRTWVERRHPQPVSHGPGLFVGGPELVILSAGDNGWYVSTDGARTFRHDRQNTDTYVPPEYHLTWQEPGQDPRYHLDCTSECVAMRREPSGATTPLPTRPPIGTGNPSDVRAGRDGRLWVVGLDQQRPVVAVSADGGRTWRRQEMTLPEAAERFFMAAFRSTADGAELWLEAYPDTWSGATAGRSVRLRKQVGLPYLWRLVGDEWRPQGTRGRPDAPEIRQYPASVAALGDGLALVTGRTGPWLVADAWTPFTMPIDVGQVQNLADGAVMARSTTDSGTVLIGTRKDRAFTWTRVTVGSTR